ncbi:flagellar hook-length control protein FliK [uncultured Deefgea sp.]|uniref:flagellar hook-length control protein FliK n=1 Tax=uncultured Deefgea sp. TaxID=1304914 RepID=UPI002595CF6B|nr:flagellar hook-length control protein FliK [uncultured Deefgea sp.]
MLPGNMASTLLTQYLRGQQGVLEAVKLSPDDIRLTVGEKVQATVTNLLPNGRFAVLIKDQLLDLNLPRNTQPGEKLDLTVLAKTPTLTFSLAQAEAKPTIAPAPNVALSQGAAMLSAVLNAPTDGKTAVLQQAQPLFMTSPNSAQLAGQLAGRLAESGLFYESHQAEWVSGQRPLQTLLKEPQAQFNLPATFTDEPTRDAPVSSKAAMPADAVLMNKSIADLPPEQAMRQLVRQQVDLLEQRPLIWQGVAWPDQSLRWELELKNEGEAHSELNPAQQQWQTKLDLTLPKLGELGVVASLQHGQFHLRFNALNADTADLLKQQQASLLERFAAAGLNVVQYQVSNEP